LWGQVILTTKVVLVADTPVDSTCEEIHIVDTMVRIKIPGEFNMEDLCLKVTIYFN
jgi:hypothetical protein